MQAPQSLLTPNFATSVCLGDVHSSAPPPNLFERDRLANDALHTVLRSGRGDWLELMHLAPLASQYHLSAYGLLKFGSLGA